MVPVAVKYVVGVFNFAVRLVDIIVNGEAEVAVLAFEADPVACSAFHVGGVVCAEAEEIAVVVG